MPIVAIGAYLIKLNRSVNYRFVLNILMYVNKEISFTCRYLATNYK